MAPTKHVPSKSAHRQAVRQEKRIQISPYVTLIVNPQHMHTKKRITEASALAALRPALASPTIMPQLREIAAGACSPQIPACLPEDEDALKHIAHDIVSGHGVALIIHTPPPALPSEPDALLLTHLIYGEATRYNDGIEDEMAAIAYSAINRAKYLQDNPKVHLNFFGANDRTLSGVVERADQYGSYQSNLWNQVDNPSRMTDDERDVLITCIRVAKGAAAGTIKDPFAAKGGTYSMRTKGSSAPGGAYVKFEPQIENAHNDFYGLKPPEKKDPKKK